MSCALVRVFHTPQKQPGYLRVISVCDSGKNHSVRLRGVDPNVQKRYIERIRPYNRSLVFGRSASLPLISKNSASRLVGLLIWCVGAVACPGQQQQAARRHVSEIFASSSRVFGGLTLGTSLVARRYVFVKEGEKAKNTGLHRYIGVVLPV